MRKTHPVLVGFVILADGLGWPDLHKLLVNCLVLRVVVRGELGECLLLVGSS